MQQADASGKRGVKDAISPEEAARRARRASLELARARAAADLQRAGNPGHRAMLETALAALDEQLAALGGESR